MILATVMILATLRLGDTKMGHIQAQRLANGLALMVIVATFVFAWMRSG